MITKSVTVPESSRVHVAASLADTSGDPITITSWSSNDTSQCFTEPTSGNEVDIVTSTKSAVFTLTAYSASGPVLQVNVTVPTGDVSEGNSTVTFGTPAPR